MNLKLENLTFGIPNTKELKQVQNEPYADEVVFSLMAEKVNESTTTRIMQFNTKAMTELSLAGKKIILIGDGSFLGWYAKDMDNSLLVAKKGTIRSKDTYLYIVNRFKLDTTVDNHFILSKTILELDNADSIDCWAMELITENTDISSDIVVESKLPEEVDIKEFEPVAQ